MRGFLCLGALSQIYESGRKAHSTHQHMRGTRGRLSGKAERDVGLKFSPHSQMICCHTQASPVDEGLR